MYICLALILCEVLKQHVHTCACMHVLYMCTACVCVCIYDILYPMSQNFKDKQQLVAKITSFVPKTVLIVMVSACMDIPCT